MVTIRKTLSNARTEKFNYIFGIIKWVSFILFFNFIVFLNYKTTIVTGEMIEREKENVYDERKSPTGTTLSV